MSNLLSLPISRAIALTVFICGICSFWFFGGPDLQLLDTSREAEAQEAVIEAQRTAIDALQRRMARIEGELDKYSVTQKSAALQETSVHMLIEDLRIDLEDLRTRRTASPDLPLPLAYYDISPKDQIVQVNEPEKKLSFQTFDLRTAVSPEAIVVVQGKDPGSVISVEILDSWNRWIEVYTGPDLSHDPSSETWVECPDTPATNKIRVAVSGSLGVEAVGVAVEEAVHWTMSSN
ncbi:MAG: hypothetical protein AAEJ04_07355 [Planctomycetota bacterium]